MYEQADINITQYTLVNAGCMKRLYLYGEVPVRLGLWNSRNSIDLSYNLYKNNVKRVGSFLVDFYSINRFKFSENCSALLKLSFNQREKRLYMTQKSDFMGVDLEGNIDCVNNKLNINFGVRDLLNSRGRSKQLFTNGDLNHETRLDNISRNFFLKLTYNFTAGSKKSEQHDKTHSNQEEIERM